VLYFCTKVNNNEEGVRAPDIVSLSRHLRILNGYQVECTYRTQLLQPSSVIPLENESFAYMFYLINATQEKTVIQKDGKSTFGFHNCLQVHSYYYYSSQRHLFSLHPQNVSEDEGRTTSLYDLRSPVPVCA